MGDIAGQPETLTRNSLLVEALERRSLLTLQEMGITFPSATAITLRQDAGQEEMVVVKEDLSKLASKIKRILIDEARRHGIEVT